MARRTQNRMEKRAEYEAYERQKAEDEDTTADEEEDEDEDDEEEEEEAEAEAGDEAGDDDEGGDDDEEAPKPKKKAKKKPVKEPAKKPKSRARTPKVVRMKVVWGVFNNSNVRVAVYEYPRKKDAEEHAARLTNDKKSTHFVQPVKEPIEEKKEKEG